jgi:hypothetical protein
MNGELDLDNTDDTAAAVVQGETLDDLAALAEQDDAAPPAPEAPAPSAETVQILELAWGTALMTFAPNWLRISEMNRRELAKHGIETEPAARVLALGFAPLVELYMPAGVTGGPWGQAAMALAAAFGPCIGQPLKLPEPKQPDQEPEPQA